MKKIYLYYYVSGELTPLPFAIVYESGADGKYIDGKWLAQTDENGYIEIPDNLTTSHLTVSWQTQKDVMPYSLVLSGSDIATSIAENILDPVIITDDNYPTDDEMISDSKKFFGFLIAGVLLYKAFNK